MKVETSFLCVRLKTVVEQDSKRDCVRKLIQTKSLGRHSVDRDRIMEIRFFFFFFFFSFCQGHVCSHLKLKLYLYLNRISTQIIREGRQPQRERERERELFLIVYTHNMNIPLTQYIIDGISHLKNCTHIVKYKICQFLYKRKKKGR